MPHALHLQNTKLQSTNTMNGSNRSIYMYTRVRMCLFMAAIIFQTRLLHMRVFIQRVQHPQHAISSSSIRLRIHCGLQLRSDMYECAIGVSIGREIIAVFLKYSFGSCQLRSVRCFGSSSVSWALCQKRFSERGVDRTRV